jgi:hypothetical protein
VVAYTEKRDVEESQARNRTHFNQAAGTPFTVFPLSEVGGTDTAFKTSHLPDISKMPAGTFGDGTILELLKRPLPEPAVNYQLPHFPRRLCIRNQSGKRVQAHLLRSSSGSLQTVGQDNGKPE